MRSTYYFNLRLPVGKEAVRVQARGISSRRHFKTSPSTSSGSEARLPLSFFDLAGGKLSPALARRINSCSNGPSTNRPSSFIRKLAAERVAPISINPASRDAVPPMERTYGLRCRCCDGHHCIEG
jgi:hypothetical protein